MLRRIRLITLSVAIQLAAAYPASGLTHLFSLSGSAGMGLLPGNVNGVVFSTGSGGEIGAGISYDDVTNILNINVAWGSGNGFNNLTGHATVGHLHGPTINSTPTGFTQNAGVVNSLHLLPGVWNNSASLGLVQKNITLTAGEELDLLAQRYYIDIHTNAYPGGEIRGHLVLSVLPGDFNRDGTVDAADYVVWRKQLQQMGDNLPADGNNNGTVDELDRAFYWQRNFGSSSAGGGSAGASPSDARVPEPATLLLLMFAVAGWCVRRCRAA
jgi:CHRD domain-containing protein/dockerin type I repeat protein/PEP-CTERM motif-containing protein